MKRIFAIRFFLLFAIAFAGVNLYAQSIRLTDSEVLSRTKKIGQKQYVSFRSPMGGFAVCESHTQPGFVIVNTVDEGPAILGYSDRGSFDEACQNPGFQLLMKAYSQPSSRRPAVLQDSELAEFVEPLIHDTWNQYSPYNILCPTIEGEHCATGCVAHSMAQVVRYWRQGTSGETYTYEDSLGCGQILSATLPSRGYNYDLMLDSYVEGQYTQEQLDAVARLLYDCGVLAEMKYGVKSSGARSIRQPIALASYLGFDDGLQMYFRDFYSYQDWIRMLKSELTQHRPVLMSAQSPSLSHAFICDGYDAEGLFHLNLGMSGDADGYYYLPYLTPKQAEWYDFDNPEGGMNLIQSAVMGIRPEYVGESADTPHNVFAFAGLEPIVASADRDGELKLSTQNMSNVGWNVLQGQLSLLLMKGDEVEAVLAEYGHEFLLEEVDDTSYTDTLAFTIPASVKDGTYRVVPAFPQVEAKSAVPQVFFWEEARTSMGTPNYLLLNVSSSGVSLAEDEQNTAYVTLESFEFPQTIERGSYPEFSFTFQNHVSEYCGRFYVVLQPVDDEDETYFYIQFEGLTLAPEESTYRYFHRTRVNIQVGDYYLRVAYDQNLFNDSLRWVSEEPLQVVHVTKEGMSVELPHEELSHQIYDLQGRMLQSRPRGFYIEDRRKVLNTK
ncbi:MAG: C10 family peptidase [Bacteroidaceae bacterium]|nr:C10 family peptidase [Bacteroidaceae bacterium]